MPGGDVLTLQSMVDQVTHIYANEELFGSLDGTTYTAEEFDERTKSVARAYQEMGVEPGERIAFLSRPNIDHCVAYFASSLIGAVPSNLHHRDSPHGLARNIEEIDPQIIVYHSEFEELVDNISKELTSTRPRIQFGGDGRRVDSVTRYDELIERGGEPESVTAVSEDDPAIIAFTSGTTGAAKPIVLSNSSILACARSGQHLYRGITADHRKLMIFGPSFIAWIAHFIPFMNAGAKTVFAPEFDPHDILDVIERERITHISMTVTMWNQLLSEDVDQYDLSSIQMALYGGEVSSPELISKLRNRVCDHVLTAYGTTETAGLGGGAVIHSDGLDKKGFESVGRPMLNSDIIVANPEDDDISELPRGENGEILISGPGVQPKVWNDEEKTAELMTNGWFHSGDLGYLDEDGYVFLEGRIDNLIISKGINIQAEEVEAKLDEHPNVQEVAIVGVPDEEWGEKVTAHIYSAGELTADEIEAWCRENEELSDYKMPREFIFHSEGLPRTVTGKLNRSALRPD